jgi:uncharacterized protein YukE
METVSITSSTAAAFVGIVAALALAWRLFRDGVRKAMWEPLGDLVRRIDNLERVNAQRFADLDNAIGKVVDQFQPNGGSSHHDRMEKLHTRIESIADKLDRMSGA